MYLHNHAEVQVFHLKLLNDVFLILKQYADGACKFMLAFEESRENYIYNVNNVHIWSYMYASYLLLNFLKSCSWYISYSC